MELFAAVEGDDWQKCRDDRRLRVLRKQEVEDSEPSGKREEHRKERVSGLHRTDEDHAGQERDKDWYGGVLRGQEAENDCNQLRKAEKRGETGI